MTTTTPPVIYPPGSTPPHAEASLGSKEFNPKIPIESEECNSMPPNGKSCWFPVGYRGEALLSVGADIWFSPRAESGEELRPSVVTIKKLFQLTPIRALQANRAEGLGRNQIKRTGREIMRANEMHVKVLLDLF